MSIHVLMYFANQHKSMYQKYESNQKVEYKHTNI